LNVEYGGLPTMSAELSEDEVTRVKSASTRSSDMVRSTPREPHSGPEHSVT